VVGFGAALLLLNRPWPLHEAAIYLTIMFTGTVIHRISTGAISARAGWSVVGVVAAACCVSFALHADPEGAIKWYSHSVALVVAVLTFAAAYAVRARVQWPRALSWLGRVSYSFYLVHWVVMKSVPALPQFPGHGVLTLVMWLAITLTISELTYRFVERPAVDAGRWAVRRLKARDARRMPAPAPTPQQRAVEAEAAVAEPI
jgi:peptidoglycan/LPS O-acetylase OafA/YrhL